MKRIPNIYFGLVIALIFSQCEPFEVPEPAGSNDPVFVLNGNIDGNLVDWKSDGETYLANGFIARYGENIFGYGSQFSSVDCDSGMRCGPQISIAIRGAEAFDVETKPYPYRLIKSPESVDVYEITLFPEPSSSLESCVWTIDGSQTITTQNSQPLVFNRDQNDSSIIRIDLVSNHSNGCTTQITDYVYLPHHGCDSKINTRALSSINHVLFQADAIGSSAFDYMWEFESGPMASTKDVEYHFTELPNDGIETVMLHTEGAGCETEHIRNVVVDSTVLCNINFNYTIETTTFTPPYTASPDYGTVEITYTDELGNIYHSNNMEQPEWANYNVLEYADDYIDPLVSTDIQFEKVTVEFDVLLFNETLGTIEVRNARAVLPFR